MSTLNTVTDLAVKPEIINFAVIAEQENDGVDANGNPKFKTVIRAASREKEIESARKAGTILFEQSLSYDRAGTVSGILQIIKDEEEAVAIFNAGLKVKLNNKVKTLLEEVDEDGNPTFQPVEGSFDIRELLNEPAQRRNLSPLEKTRKTLLAIPGVSPEMVDQMLANLRAQQAL